MAKYTEEESKAIQDRARVVLTDKKLVASNDKESTFYRTVMNMGILLRSQNGGRGLYEGQLDLIRGICKRYELIVGLNSTYTPDFIQRTADYLKEAEEVFDKVNSKNPSFLTLKQYARTRRDFVLSGEKYFWEFHINSTACLVDRIVLLRDGQSEDKVFNSDSGDQVLRERLRSGELKAKDLTNLVNEGSYLLFRTTVSHE